MRQKAARIRHKIDSRGRDEVLFQELATALGYKENKLPFTLITQRLPLKLLREAPSDIESMLFGTAGFLHAADLDIYKKSTREYVRRLWDGWWPHRDELQRLILPGKIWRSQQHAAAESSTAPAGRTGNVSARLDSSSARLR